METLSEGEAWASVVAKPSGDSHILPGRTVESYIPFQYGSKKRKGPRDVLLLEFAPPHQGTYRRYPGRKVLPGATPPSASTAQNQKGVNWAPFRTTLTSSLGKTKRFY